MPRYRLGIDIGGTFTDFLLMDEDTGRHHLVKVASFADHPSQAILEGLHQLAETYHVAPSEITSLAWLGFASATRVSSTATSRRHSCVEGTFAKSASGCWPAVRSTSPSISTRSSKQRET